LKQHTAAAEFNGLASTQTGGTMLLERKQHRLAKAIAAVYTAFQAFQAAHGWLFLP
jgi:hypothetical protein